MSNSVKELLNRFGHLFPDFSSLTLLVPSHHVATPIKQAFTQLTGATILLPRIHTFSSYAQTMQLDQPIASLSLRLAQIYSALKSKQWFKVSDLWSVSSEIAKLFDELTFYDGSLPETIDDLVITLQEAYEAKADDAMYFEARLIYEMWYAFNRANRHSSDEIDAAVAYKIRLAKLAAQAEGPLCVVGLDDLMPIEKNFLVNYSKAQPVIVINKDLSVNSMPLIECLNSAWRTTQRTFFTDEENNPEVSASEKKQNLLSRAQSFKEKNSNSPLINHLQLYSADGLEDEALYASQRIIEWVKSGKRNIALVALDRLSARRARAILERYEILLADESGWTLSTTSATTIIMRLLEVVDDNFYHRDLLDLIKSPFFCAEIDLQARKQAVYQLENDIRQRSIVAGLDNYQKLVEKFPQESIEREIIARLAKASNCFNNDRQTLSDWLSCLLSSLNEIGAMKSLNADNAGRQLITLLSHSLHDLSQHNELIDFKEWRRWLNSELETAVFQDTEIISPIVMTSLSSTRYRSFDAVILIGADETHLTASSASGNIFNQAVRQQLGLPGPEQKAEAIQRDLTGLISSTDICVVTWQSSVNGEHNAISPWFARLNAFHKMAYWQTLEVKAPKQIYKAHNSWQEADVRSSVVTEMPRPKVLPDLIPDKISASGYNSLIACPYQFFARHILRLNSQDEVIEEMEKRKYGELIHEILASFHEKHTSILSLSDEVAIQDMKEITDNVFATYIKNNYTSIAWKFRWHNRTAAYIAWSKEWESRGWLFKTAEEKYQRFFPLQNGKELQLHGRVDRIDQNKSTGELAVLDYKTQKLKPLADKLAKVGEDMQLAVYAMLINEDVTQAAYVSLDEKSKVEAVISDEGFPELVEVGEKRLVQIFNDMAEGHVLPANGDNSICQYCEMRGVCRRDYWNGEVNS